MANRPLSRGVFLALVCSCAFLAADADPRMGLQATLALPQSDLKTWVGAGPGFGLGFHQLMDLGKGEAFRPRFDLQSFSGRNRLSLPASYLDPTLGPEAKPLDPVGMSNSLLMLTISLDSLFYFSRETDDGVYLVGGVGLSVSRFKGRVDGAAKDGSVWPQPGTTLSDSSKKLSLSAGLGHQFNRKLGAEARVGWTRGQFGPANLRLPAVTLACTYRFAATDWD